jgi:hypothetical protein
VGSLTNYQGHDLGIDCLLTDATPDQADNVALSVEVRHLTTTPLMDAAVCWGHPSGHVEAELFPDPVPMSSETLDKLEAHLPILYDAVELALKRGRPPDET